MWHIIPDGLCLACVLRQESTRRMWNSLRPRVTATADARATALPARCRSSAVQAASNGPASRRSYERGPPLGPLTGVAPASHHAALLLQLSSLFLSLDSPQFPLFFLLFFTLNCPVSHICLTIKNSEYDAVLFMKRSVYEMSLRKSLAVIMFCVFLSHRNPFLKTAYIERKH